MPDTFSSSAPPSPGLEALGESSAKAASPSSPARAAAAPSSSPPSPPSPDPEPDPQEAPDNRRRFARALGSSALKPGVPPRLRSRMFAGVVAVIVAGAIALGIGVVVKPAKSAAGGASAAVNAESGSFQAGKAQKPAHFVSPGLGTAPSAASASDAAGRQPAGSTAPVAASEPGRRFSVVASRSSATAFALSGSGTVLYATQGAGPGGWSAFRAMPGSPKSAVSAPAAAADADGHLEAFVRLADGQIADGWQDAGSWHWDGAITGGAMPGTAVDNPGAVRMSNGAVAVVTRLRGGAVAVTAQKVPNGTTGWGGWVVIGGELAGDPVPFTDANGNLDIFGVSTAGTLVLDQWNGGSWTGWQTVGSGGPTDLAYDPTPASNESGSTEVFVTTTAGTVDHVWLTSGGWVWGVPLAANRLGATVVDTVGAAEWPGGRIDVFARLADGGVANTRQNTPNGATGWSGWSSLPGSLIGAPTAYLDSRGELEILALASPSHAVGEYWNGSRWVGPADLPGAF